MFIVPWNIRLVTFFLQYAFSMCACVSVLCARVHAHTQCLRRLHNLIWFVFYLLILPFLSHHCRSGASALQRRLQSGRQHWGLPGGVWRGRGLPPVVSVRVCVCFKWLMVHLPAHSTRAQRRWSRLNSPCTLALLPPVISRAAWRAIITTLRAIHRHWKPLGRPGWPLGFLWNSWICWNARSVFTSVCGLVVTVVVGITGIPASSRNLYI